MHKLETKHYHLKVFILILVVLLISVFVCKDTMININSNETALTSVVKNIPYHVYHPGKSVVKASGAIIDYSNTKYGYAMVKYTKKTSKKIVAMVQKGKGKSYTYTIKPQKWYALPFSQGSGSYTVQLFKQVKGTSYHKLVGRTLTVKLNTTLAPFRRPTIYSDYNTAHKTVNKAVSLAKGCKTNAQKVEKIYNWIIKNVKYDYSKAKTVQSGYIPNVENTYNTKKGICFDYAALMVSMLRSQKVPCRLVIGWVGGDGWHAWVEVYSSKKSVVKGVVTLKAKKWTRFDPTFASTGNNKYIISYINNGANYDEVYYY